MSILTPCSVDTGVISALHDKPNTDDNLNAAALKAKFDKAGDALKYWLNNTLIPEIEAQFQVKLVSGSVTFTMLDSSTVTPTALGAAKTVHEHAWTDITDLTGMSVSYSQLAADAKSAAYTATVETTDWDSDDLEADVSIPGLLSTDIIFVSPASTSVADWRDCEIYCSAQANDGITLVCSEVPENDISVQVLVVK